ncbi:glycosyltransferase family 2 protein [Actinomadura miaoliensis]|uniref:Glycosyltransferase 2-like domain-containing protein n=1 Tax=Actinomadura miaoliensis TaxID=430685 RepID=A0ABP7VJI6_9ACTN
MTTAIPPRPEPPPGVGATTAPARRPQAESYVPWKPGLLPFLLPLAVILVFCFWSYQPGGGALNWVLSVVWSLPVIGSVVGMQGAVLMRRRARQLRRLPPPSPAVHDALLVVVPTVGRRDTYPALRRSVESYVRHLPAYFPSLRVDIVTEEGCEAADAIAALARSLPRVRVVEVPAAYRTRNGTRFKARANQYSHELRIAEGEARDDVWVLHMDDDTAVGPDTAAAMAQFVNRQRRAGAKAKHLAQGILTYPRENAVSRFTWLADAVRPADDIARFRAITGSGTPIAGLHGELLLIRASIEARIGWDFGPKAIVEDAQLALNFSQRYPGRSDWFAGRCYGASPASVRDFVKQRERWAWGLVGLVFNRTIKLRYRAFLGMCVATWALGPLQHVGFVLLVAWATGTVNTSPVSMVIAVLWAINFAYVVWCYWEGLRLNAHASAGGRRRWWEPPVVLLLIPLFSLIEGWGGLRGFIRFVRREENKFVVIAKPA